MEILNSFFAKCSEILPAISTPLKLGIIGGVLMIVLFVIGLIVASASKIDRYRKTLIRTSTKLASLQSVTDENVDDVYAELKQHPERVQMGWSNFLDHRIGVPSDYIPAKEVLSDRAYSGKHAGGKMLFAILGVIVWAAVAAIGFMYYFSYDTKFLVDNSLSFAGILMSLEFLVIPIALYIIFLLSLGIVFDKKVKRLAMAYTSFCENLDEVVVVADKEEEEFVSNNLAEINKRVEEILAQYGDDEIIEVIAAPKAVEPKKMEDIVPESLRPAPAPAPVVEPTPVYNFEEELIDEAVAATVPEKPDAEWVAAILLVATHAMEDDSVDPADLDTLGQLLEVAKSRLSDVELIESVEGCLGALADTYFEKIGA